MIIVYALSAIIANIILGAAVWAAADTDGRLLAWLRSCPPESAIIAKPIVLSAWPVAIWVYFKSRKASHAS